MWDGKFRGCRVPVMSNFCPVAIVGAGPRGLAIDAHVRARRVKFRIDLRCSDVQLIRTDGGRRVPVLSSASCQATGANQCAMRLLIYSSTVVRLTPTKVKCVGDLSEKSSGHVES